MSPPVMPGCVVAPADGAEQQRLITVLAAEIDALGFFRDPEAALGPAAEAEQAARAMGLVDLELRARLVWADALVRSGEVAAGGRAAHEVNRWAVEHEDPLLVARSNWVLAWFYHQIGDGSAQLEHALRAVEHLNAQASDRMRYDHQTALGVALGSSGSHEDARIRFGLAEEFAVALGDLDLQLSVLNNLSCLEDACGEKQAAMDAAERMLALAAGNDVPLEMTCLETAARALMGLGRYAEAEQTLLVVFDGSVGAEPGWEANALAHTLLTLAETQRLLGATGRAQATLDLCTAQCEERGLTAVRVRVLQERAELFALEGAYRHAYEMYKVFHAEAEALVSVERDVRARTLQAVFETDEARRDSLRFREMSLRDPLTGLYNRRFIDERLTGLLQEAAATAAPLSIGLVDLDYFKDVNDTFSHEVGDDVLKHVAGLLAGMVTEPAFAARLGGEEFLLVLPGYTPQEAVSCCEAARLRVRSYGWADLTGDLAITTSIGVASAVGGHTTKSDLLADADRHLYSAKRAGRDRVVAGPG